MIDISLIEENYSNMSDQQLLNLANLEGQELTPEALEVLKKEFLKRRLDIHVYNAIGERNLIQQHQNIQEAKENVSTEFTKTLWNYALDEKKEGKSDLEIIKGLQGKGLDEAHSILFIKSLEHKATELLKAHDTEMITGGIICVLGTVITFWTMTVAQNGEYYVIAWGAIIFGAIRFFKGMGNKDKYKAILENISAEQKKDFIK